MVYFPCMPKRFEAEDDGEVESCYLENGVYVPWSQIAADIDKRSRREEWIEWFWNFIGIVLALLAISWFLVETELVSPRSRNVAKPTASAPAPSQPGSQSQPSAAR